MKRQDGRLSLYQRALEITWLTIIFLIPLFFNPLSYEVFPTSKTLLLEFLVLLMLAFWVADWIQNTAGPSRLNWRNIFKSPLHLAILIFGLLGIVSTAASITPAISFWGSYFRRAGLLTLICWVLFFLIVAQQLRTRAQLLRAAYVLLASSGIVAYFGILQHFFPEMSLVLFHSSYPGRIVSTAGNALSLSVYLAMVIPFNLALITYSWLNRKKGRNIGILFGLIILLLLQFWCLWLAQYSITILLYIIAPVIFIALLGWTKKSKILLGLGAACILGLLIIAGLMLAPLLFSSPASEATATQDLNAEPISEEVGLQTLGWRVQYWQSAIDIVIKSPEVPFSNDKIHELRRLIGYGPETFVVTFQLFFPENMEVYHTHFLTPLTRPHNHYLYLATTVGLLGVLSFLSILAVFLFLCFRYLSRSTSDIEKLMLIAMVAAMVQYMADIFFNPSAIPSELVFWLTLSLVPVIGRLTDIEPETTAAQDAVQIGGSRKPYVNKSRRYLSAGCVAVIAIIGLGITIRPFLADTYFLKGLKARTNEEAIQAFNTAINLSPKEAMYWHGLGLYAWSMADNAIGETRKAESFTLATHAFEQAQRLEPYIAFRYYILATVYTDWANGGAVDKWPAALSMYDKASQLIPRNPVTLNMWALALILKGDLNEAQAKLDFSASLDPSWAETSFLYGLALAKEGENTEAALKITAPIQQNSANLDDFFTSCLSLAGYDMVGPLNDVLKAYVDMAPDEWVPHAMLGITSLFVASPDESLNEFNIAMRLVPDDDTGYLFRIIARLAGMRPDFRELVPKAATEWRDKLTHSPESDTLLPLLDQLTGTTE